MFPSRQRVVCSIHLSCKYNPLTAKGHHRGYLYKLAKFKTLHLVQYTLQNWLVPLGILTKIVLLALLKPQVMQSYHSYFS